MIDTDNATQDTIPAVSPADYVITLFNGTSSLAHLLNAHPGVRRRERGLYPSTIHRWREGANAGKIPTKYHDALLDIADKQGLTLTPDILVRGAKELPVVLARRLA